MSKKANDKQAPITFPDPEDITLNYHRGNEYSVAANPSKEAKKSYCANLLEILRTQGGKICEELEIITGYGHQGCSPRLTEMEQKRLVYKEGKRKTKSGRWAGIYHYNHHYNPNQEVSVS